MSTQRCCVHWVEMVMFIDGVRKFMILNSPNNDMFIVVWYLNHGKYQRNGI